MPKNLREGIHRRERRATRQKPQPPEPTGATSELQSFPVTGRPSRRFGFGGNGVFTIGTVGRFETFKPKNEARP